MKRSTVWIIAALLSWGHVASGEEWKTWPPNANEHETIIQVPPGFRSVRWSYLLREGTGEGGRQLLNVRFRSKDGKAEFGVLVNYVRTQPKDAAARRIELAPAHRERIDSQKSRRRKVESEQGPYWIYDEEVTISGPGYTRYRLNSFSTSSLPGAASVLWEFQVADEATRKRYAPTWKRFKESLRIESD